MADHFTLRLVDSYMLAPTVRHLVFERADGQVLAFVPGQFLQVHFQYDDGTPTKHVTGGSLPVEIWSRFMRGAHQGVPVASLPGASTGNFFSGLFGGGGSSRPVPPAPVQPVAANTSATTGSGSLDGWLLNSLFGRR